MPATSNISTTAHQPTPHPPHHSGHAAHNHYHSNHLDETVKVNYQPRTRPRRPQQRTHKQRRQGTICEETTLYVFGFFLFLPHTLTFL